MWKPKIGDSCVMNINPHKLASITNIFTDTVGHIQYTLFLEKGIGTGRETHYEDDFFSEYAFAPTLEQLFEIWSYLCNTNNKAHPDYLAGDHLPTKFIYRIYDYLENEGRKAWFDKEICLEIIMKDFYNKAWTGSKWVKAK